MTLKIRASYRPLPPPQLYWTDMRGRVLVPSLVLGLRLKVPSFLRPGHPSWMSSQASDAQGTSLPSVTNKTVPLKIHMLNPWPQIS